MKKPRRCGDCGSYETEYRNQKGNYFPYKQHPAVKLTVDCMLRQCINCGNVMFSLAEAKTLDKAIEDSLST